MLDFLVLNYKEYSDHESETWVRTIIIDHTENAVKRIPARYMRDGSLTDYAWWFEPYKTMTTTTEDSSEDTANTANTAGTSSVDDASSDNTDDASVEDSYISMAVYPVKFGTVKEFRMFMVALDFAAHCVTNDTSYKPYLDVRYVRDYKKLPHEYDDLTHSFGPLVE